MDHSNDSLNELSEIVDENTIDMRHLATPLRSAKPKERSNKTENHFRPMSPQIPSLSYMEAATEKLVRKAYETVQARNGSASAKMYDTAAAVFVPSEISGRSTECDIRPLGARLSNVANIIATTSSDQSSSEPSVEQILGDSFSKGVRNMGADLRQKKVRHSYGAFARQSNASSISLANTADMSVDSKMSFRNLSGSLLERGSDSSVRLNDDVWTSLQQPSIGFPVAQELSHMGEVDGSFRSTNLSEFLNNEQRDWNDEYAVIPSQGSISTATIHSAKRILDETDFSSSRAVPVNQSMGTYFAARSEQLRDMIPNDSPKKQRKPEALLPPAQSNSPVDKLNAFDVLSTAKINKMLDSDFQSPKSMLEQCLKAPHLPQYADNSLEQSHNRSPNELSVLSSSNTLTPKQQHHTGAPNNVTPNRLQKFYNNVPHTANDVQRNQPSGASSSRFLGDTVSCIESLEDFPFSDSCDSYPDPDNVPSTVKSNPDTYVVDSCKTPPLLPGRAVPKVNNVHALQSRSRLLKFSSDGGDTMLPESQISDPTGSHSDEAAGYAAELSDRASPASSTFSSPQFSSSSKSSQFGSVGDLHATGHELSALKASETELCWASTKLRHSSARRVTLKNMSGRKLSLKMSIRGPGFQIAGINNKLTLQSQECHTLTVIFCPTVIGPAIGQVEFLNADDSLAGRLCRLLPLFGYGGNTVMQVLGVTRGPVGIPFLSLGDREMLYMSSRAKETLTVYNRGPCNGMVVICVAPQASSHMNDACIRITPSKFVLGAESRQEVVVEFAPSKEDMRNLMRKGKAPVQTIGTLEIIFGEDATRMRIARLLCKMRTSGQVYASGKLDFLESGFSDEHPAGFEHFDESPHQLDALFRQFKSEQVALTVENYGADQNISTEADVTNSLQETMQFCTMREIVPLQRKGSELTLARSWSVYPLRMTLSAAEGLSNNVKHLTIASQFESVQTFELASSLPHTLEIRPTTGMVRPGEQVQVTVRLLKAPPPNEDIVLSVFIENDMMEVQIDVQKRHPSHGGRH